MHHTVLPTIIWLQTSQKCGFLNVCSRKVCAVGSGGRGARDGEQMVNGSPVRIVGGGVKGGM